MLLAKPTNTKAAIKDFKISINTNGAIQPLHIRLKGKPTHAASRPMVSAKNIGQSIPGIYNTSDAVNVTKETLTMFVILRSLTKPAIQTIIKKPYRKPAVGPIKAILDIPPAKTGNPIAPSNK